MHSEREKLRFLLTRDQRLRGRLRVDEVFKKGKRRTAHPLTVHFLRREDNGLARIGISIGRRCGTAVVRNLIKRRLREAYRLMQQEAPAGYDMLIVVKPHAPLEVFGGKGYQARLRQLILSAG